MLSSDYKLRQKLLASTVAAAWLAMGVQAYAQEAEAEEAVVDVEEAVEDTGERTSIRVTGSRFERDEFSSISPITVITADDISAAGLIDTADVLQSTSIASGSTQINAQFGGFVTEGGPGAQQVSLRGLGAGRTLGLINGRRIGPAGTRGTVGAVDYNVLPSSIIQRIEILKDGASSVYGSDAAAGVINVITRTTVDRPELNFGLLRPFEDGGDGFDISGAYGFDLFGGNIALSGSYEKLNDLSRGDRDYLSCPQDLAFDAVTGARLDIPDLAVTGINNTAFKCYNSWANTIDAFGLGEFYLNPASAGPLAGFDFVPDSAGSIAQLSARPYNLDRQQEQDAIPEIERYSFYGTGLFNIGSSDLFVEALYSHRETRREAFRQFFPFEFPGEAFNPLPAFARPITLIPFNGAVEVDFYQVSATLRGDFPTGGFLDGWNYDLYAGASLSEGTYTEENALRLDNIDDFQRGGGIDYLSGPTGPICVRLDPTNTDPCVLVDYFSPDFVAGNFTPEEYAFLFTEDVGETTYEQTVFTGSIAGPVFDVPAGEVSLALGLEHRRFEIEDTPGPLSRRGAIWGLTSAGITKGDDSVTEFFGEVEVPLLAKKPMFEELTFNGSYRYFDYDSTDADSVYKLGLNWQVDPGLRLRGSYGTSYIAPQLFQLYLADQTGFLAQGSIDPCIEWGESTNENLRANCAAEGIPATYGGIGSSATIITGGGAGVLEPETSQNVSWGVVFTPEFANIQIAIDYFDVKIEDQITQLGAGNIAGACYASQTFPNEFCTLLTRDLNPASPTYLQILEVRDSFVNINEQKTRGIDLDLEYEHGLNFGDLLFDIGATWTFTDKFDLFEGETGAFSEDDFNSTIGEPNVTANARVAFERGDWRTNYFVDFVGATSDARFFSPNQTYFGQPANYIWRTPAVYYHSLSLQYRNDNWSVTAAVNNLLDEEPPAISRGIRASGYGNVPIAGSQYDLRGRRGVIQIQRRF